MKLDEALSRFGLPAKATARDEIKRLLAEEVRREADEEGDQFLMRLLNGLPRPRGAGSVKIQAEAKLKYSALVEIMDTCMKCGFREVGISPSEEIDESK